MLWDPERGGKKKFLQIRKEELTNILSCLSDTVMFPVIHYCSITAMNSRSLSYLSQRKWNLISVGRILFCCSVSGRCTCVRINWGLFLWFLSVIVRKAREGKQELRDPSPDWFHCFMMAWKKKTPSKERCQRHSHVSLWQWAEFPRLCTNGGSRKLQRCLCMNILAQVPTEGRT